MDTVYNNGSVRLNNRYSAGTVKGNNREVLMVLKPGVDISRLNREIRRTLPKLDAIYKLYGEVLVITSTYEGTHGAGSLHYANDAVDVGLPRKNKSLLFNTIREDLDLSLYDVVKENTHNHVEFDPDIGR